MKVSQIHTTEPDLVTRRQRLRDYYIDQRGADAVGGVLIPRTTSADVKQLAAVWTLEVNKVTPRDADDRRQIAAWAQCMHRIAAHGTQMNEPYPLNEEFWQHCTSKLAIWLNAHKVVPSKWSLIFDATVESIKGVPGTLGDAGRSVGSGVGGAFGWVGDQIDDASTAAKWALVLGGVGVAAAVVVPRLRKRSES